MLPYNFVYGDKTYKLVDLDLRYKNYMVLESLPTQSSINRVVHIIHPRYQLKDSKFMVGRGQECHIGIRDISVSRKHCEIRYRDGMYYITDEKSKFGTSLLV